MKILVLNLCTTWTTPRKQRLDAVAEFCLDNGVDVLLVSEGVRSCFIYHTIQYLANRLGFHQYSKSNIGFPFFWEFRVGVISRYPILSTASLNPVVAQSGDLLDRFPLPWRKRAVAAVVDVPGIGITNLISVHLTSCPKTLAEKALELAILSEWKQLHLPDSDATICGGDWNTTLDAPGFQPDYIVAEGSATITEIHQVLAGQIVTDHQGGVLVEIGR